MKEEEGEEEWNDAKERNAKPIKVCAYLFEDLGMHASGKCTQTGLLVLRLLMAAPGEQVLYSVVNGTEEEGKQSMYTRLGPNARHRMRNDVYAGLPLWTANE